PILDCGFDLHNTPLMEYKCGGLEVVFCQLDIACRYGTDPVASKVFYNMVMAGTNTNVLPSKTCCYYGNPAGRNYMDDIEVPYTDITGDINQINSYDINISDDGIGTTAARAVAVSNFVANGGTFVGLWLSVTTIEALLDAACHSYTWSQMTYYRCTRANAPGGLLSGLGLSEFYWRENWDGGSPHNMLSTIDLQPLNDVPEVIAVVSHGAGRYIFIEINPAWYGNTEYYHLAYEKTARIYSRIFSNLDVDIRPAGPRFYIDSFPN
ncbi:unnamed protein product, partial [marine sediment metagenome]